MTQTPVPARATGRRMALGAGVLAGLGVLAMGVVYVERGAIGVRLATAYLQSRGVPAVIRIERLDSGGFTGSLELGPHGDPDLTVAHLEAVFAPVPMLKGGLAPRIAELRLVQPHLKASFDGRTFHFGSLQPLVDEALKRPSGGGRSGPNVIIQDGIVDLATPYGGVALTGDGQLHGGRIAYAKLALAPAALTGGGYSAVGLNGAATLTGAAGDRLQVVAWIAASRLGGPDLTLRTADLHLHMEAPQPGGVAGTPHPLVGEASLLATEAFYRGVSVVSPSGGIRLAGATAGGGQDFGFSGRASVKVRGRSGRRGADGLQDLAVDLDADRLSVRRPAQRLQASGDYRLRVSAGNGLVVADGRRVRVDRLQAAGQGSAILDGAHSSLNFVGGVKAQAGLSSGDARALLAGLSMPEAFATLRAQLIRDAGDVRIEAPRLELALDGGSAVLRAPQPITAGFGGGASVRIEGDPLRPLMLLGAHTVSGALTAQAAGPDLPTLRLQLARYSATADRHGGTLDAAVVADASGSFGPLQRLNLHAAVAAERRGGVLTLTAPHCATAALDGYVVAGVNSLKGFSAEVCPAGAPVATITDGGWSAAARLQKVRAVSPTAAVHLRDGEGELGLQSRGKSLAGDLSLAHATLTDASPETRFRPLQATGRVELARQVAQGAVQFTLAGQPAPLGDLSFRQDFARDVGEARLQTMALHFQPGGLQPASVAPASARWASDVSGDAQAEGSAQWRRGGLSSHGQVTLNALDLHTPAGLLSGLNGRLELSSLSPLSTSSAQMLTATRLQTLLPLTDITASFQLTPTTLVLDRASATVAKGVVSLDSTVVGLTPSSSLSGMVRITGVDVQDVIAGLNLANAMAIQGRLDGELPFTFGPAGLRLAEGRLRAEGPGRLTIRRQALTSAVATGGAAGAQPNAVQDFAYQALENLAFDSLDAEVGSRPQGRLGVVLHVKGRHDPASAAPTRIGLLALLRGHAFDKPLPLPKGTPIDLTLDSSLNLDDLLTAYADIGRPQGSAKVGP